MSTLRIDATPEIIEAMRRLQETMDRLQIEAQAIRFGARAQAGVDGAWKWDGAGWAEPDNGDGQQHTPEDQQNLPES